MKFRPLHDRIVVKRIDAEEKTKGGIIIPDTAKEKPQEGEVVAVGEGKYREDGTRQTLDVKAGDRVLFGKYSGSEVKIDDEELLIMREDEILGIIQRVTNRRARIRGLIDFLRYLGQQNTLYNISGDRSVLPFETIDNRPILKVRINGSKNLLRFVLDTGSGMSVISDDTARKLGIKPVARGGMARAVGGVGRFEIVYGYLNSMDVGDIRIENVPVYIRHFYDQQTPVDGYLGIAALARMLTAVDYGNRRMTLVKQRNITDLGSVAERPTAANIQGTGIIRPGIEIPLRTTTSGFLSGEVMVEGIKKPLNFIIDTGATVSVLSERAAELDEALEFIQQDRMRVFGAAGIAENVKIALLPKVVVGNYAREKINAAVLDLEPINETAGFQQSGILGGNFLRHFRLIFDFQRGIVRLEPLDANRPATETLPQESTSGP